MLADRYDLALSTQSGAARDAYVRASDLALTLYPGAEAAYDRAIAADPGFAMAHAGKAQVLAREGKVAEAKAALTAARALAGGLPERESSHIAFFEHVFGGRSAAAIEAMHTHLDAWPRDALVVATAANPNGVLGASGQVGQKRQIAVLMDKLAPHYGDDFWFLAYHAMGLSEDGQFAAARPKIERSIALNPNNAHATHSFAHVCYESGDAETGRAYLASWLETYPRDGFFHGHLSWHRSLFELGGEHWDAASTLFQDAIVPERHSGGPQQRISDGAAFLWRSELAGYQRDPAAWAVFAAYAKQALPRPGSGLADLHVILAYAAVGDMDALDQHTQQMTAMAAAGRYPSGSFLPAVAQGIAAFARGAFATAADILGPLAAESERIGGSRAQHDLIEFTLLKSYVNAERSEDARRLLDRRRRGACGALVAGVH